MVAARVMGPKSPSGVTPMIFCQATTSGPFEPKRIVFIETPWTWRLVLLLQSDGQGRTPAKAANSA